MMTMPVVAVLLCVAVGMLACIGMMVSMMRGRRSKR